MIVAQSQSQSADFGYCMMATNSDILNFGLILFSERISNMFDILSDCRAPAIRHMILSECLKLFESV